MNAAPLTVKGLIKILKTLPPDAFVIMSIDAEGNAYHALSEEGISPMPEEGAILLYPDHDTFRGWVSKEMREMFG